MQTAKPLPMRTDIGRRAVTPLSPSDVSDDRVPVVSFVIPCLNEAQTIGICVHKAFAALLRLQLPGEVIVVDNGCTDGSPEIAHSAGAIVVQQPVRGYGAAYLAGCRKARGAYFVMVDGDDTSDFLDAVRFLAPLIEHKADLVIGDRLGGDMRPGAMSWSHRWIGNPLLSGMLRLLFGTAISDAHCGMRAFTREAWQRMRLGALGMEVASQDGVRALPEALT